MLQHKIKLWILQFRPTSTWNLYKHNLSNSKSVDSFKIYSKFIVSESKHGCWFQVEDICFLTSLIWLKWSVKRFFTEAKNRTFSSTKKCNRLNKKLLEINKIKWMYLSLYCKLYLKSNQRPQIFFYKTYLVLFSISIYLNWCGMSTLSLWR